MLDLTGHSFSGYTFGPMTVTSSGELNGPPIYRAWWSLNGNPHSADNGWISNLGTAGDPDWWKIDFGVDRKFFVDRYVVHAMNYSNAVAGGTGGWYWQGSNNDSSWNTVSSPTGQQTWPSYEARLFQCSPTNVSYRYWRFINIGAGRNYVNEFYIFGWPDNSGRPGIPTFFSMNSPTY